MPGLAGVEAVVGSPQPQPTTVVSGGSPNDGAAIAAAINNLPRDSTGNPHGVVELTGSTFNVSSTGRIASVTYTNSTTVNCVSATQADVGALLVGDNITQETTIVSVINGVSFIASITLPGTATQSLMITQPAIYLPGGVHLRGRGASYLPAHNTTIPGSQTGTFLNTTLIQDNGTGITIWGAGATDSTDIHSALRQSLRDLAVWGNPSNLLGFYCINGIWNLRIESCDISYHGWAGLGFGLNQNMVTIVDTWFNHNGSVGAATTFVTGGVLLEFPLGANSAGITFVNCMFSWNFGAGLASGNTNFATFALAHPASLIGCQFVGNKTTAASWPAGATGAGCGVVAQSNGVSNLMGCWFEQNVGIYQAIIAGAVNLLGVRFNNNSSVATNQYGCFVNGAANGAGPSFVGVVSSGATNGTALITNQNIPVTWLNCVCTDPNFLILQTGGGTGIVTSVAPAQANGYGSFLGVDCPSAKQTALAGTTAGTATWSQPFAGAAYKKFIVNLIGYENTTATAQTIAFPIPFAFAPYLARDDSGGAAVSTTLLTLPANMVATKTGWIVVEGY